MLSFIVVVCGGNMDLIKKMWSKLMWVEEWVLIFEYVYGHAKNPIATRKRWPMYTTHEEDMLLRNSKWSDDFGNERVIMHDNTNIGLPTASDGEH